MSTNPIDQNPTPKTTGSLEELFRHHLGEEAAVPARPMLWDQIDNSLLVKQNDVYRRRLTATRWVAAASLLLASLAGTGWWVGRDALLTSSDLAAVTTPTTSRTGADTREAVASAPVGTSQRDAIALGSASTATTSLETISPTVASANRPANGTTASSQIAAITRRAAGFGPGQASPLATGGRAGSMARYNGRQRYHIPPTAAITSVDGAFAARPTPTDLSPISLANTAANTGTPNTPAQDVALAATSVVAGGVVADGTGTSSLGADLTRAATTTATASSVAAEETGLLATRSTTLALTDAEALPAGLAEVSLPAEMPAADAHRWRYSGSYAAGVFNPNINFSRAGIDPQYDYNASLAFGANSPALTESAAAEYRSNLRPGFSQRLALLATRHLQGHWSMSTGLELSQATAHSASSSAFVGEQLFDLDQAKNIPSQPLQSTDFRYRLASVPVEVRYSNPVKQGWSFYGRLGGVVSALLGVRSDVEGNPEATRTYSILSAGTPYRQMLASVRGGAGAQFRTSSGKWALSAGPVADLGLVSLNAHPAQSYFAQSRPYSLGMEAALEFGR